MLAIEFQATIKNGFIKITDEYQQQFERQKSRVILMKEETLPTQDLISQLLSTPLEIDNFFPLKLEDIYD